MFGLAYLLAFGLYLLISVLVVRWAIRHARANGKSVKGWGWGAAFIMYSLVFWDWIPTVATHQYYCAADSGFWVYKTLDQWKTENPGGLEKIEKENQVWAAKYLEQWKVEHPNARTDITEDMLKKNQVSKGSAYEEFNDGHGKRNTYLLNNRFNWIVSQQDIFRPLAIIRTEQQVKDVMKDEVLAQYVDFGSGHSVKERGIPLRFWLQSTGCIGGERNYGNFLLFKRAFEGAEK